VSDAKARSDRDRAMRARSRVMLAMLAAFAVLLYALTLLRLAV
jgi:hypothetical protein